MRFCIATSDKTSWILKQFSYLFDKYCPEIDKVDIIGYSVFPELPDRYKTMTFLGTQIDMRDWSVNLLHYFNSIDDEFIVFGLDDFLPIRPIDYDVFNTTLHYMKRDSSISRYEIGVGHCWHKHKPIIKSFNDFNIHKYGEESLYKSSTQFSVWRRQELIKLLSNNWTPWDFEVIGSHFINGDVIATDGKYAFEWVQSSISSIHPNTINVSGLKTHDVEHMIKIGLFDKSKLQLGIKKDSPKYE